MTSGAVMTWQLGYFLLEGTFAGTAFCKQGMLALGDQSETDSQCLGDSR